MSKLSDLIRRVSRGEPTPLGFMAGARKPTATLVLVALINDKWGSAPAEAAAAGADAVLLTGRPNDNDISQAVSGAGGRACGVLSDDASPERLQKLRDAGIDFVVLPDKAPASALLDEQLSFMLQVRDELTDVQLRTIEPLSLEAIYVEQEIGPLTIYRQMELQRVSGLTRKPLLVRVRARAEQAELLSLRDAGVALAGVEYKEGGAGGVTSLRKTVDSMPRRKRRREEAEATLPRPSQTVAEEDDEDDI